MSKNGRRRPQFIAFEGPEGSGKTTQLRLAAQSLAASGLAITATREPGGTAIGEQIRAILLARQNRAILPQTETLLLLAARAQHVGEVIGPALARGDTVLCDRFGGATLAYQGYGRGLALDDLRGLQSFAAGAYEPDLTLLYDLPVDVGLARRQAEGDMNRLDLAGLEFHQRVREGYVALATAAPERWVILDATRPIDEVAAATLAVLRERLAAEQPLVAGTDGRNGEVR